MEPDKWIRLRELFDEAFGLDASDRSAFIARECEGDPELQTTLESLLAHSLETGSSLEEALLQVVDIEEAMATDLMLIGRNLGQYRIIEKIGQGSMGEIYRAVDTRLGRDVAIKSLPEIFTRDPERMARFEREARALASLNHPNIATIHGLEDEKGVRYLVLELIDGETLRSKLADGPLSTGDLLDFAAQIAEGLAKAHQANIVHRDLKPDNLMVTRDGFIKILDFGLARSAVESDQQGSMLPTEPDLQTEPGRVMGTSAYLSPEQARGEEVDHRSDQFALGSVLYEMATGDRAFEGETSADTLVAIMRQEPIQSDDFKARVPPRVRQILDRCLAKDPASRYESTRDLADELRFLLEHSWKIDESEGGAKTPTTSRLKRSQLLGAVLVGTALIVGAMIGLRPQGGADDGATAQTETDAPESRNLSRKSRSRAARMPEESASIAVLPLQSLGPAGEEYFADGMTDALITHLSTIEALKVISRTSVMQYRDTQKSTPQIADELGVETVLVGSVLHGGDRVRISTQLIDAITDQNLWAESYERDLSDILALQSEVAQAIADAVKVETQPDEVERIAASRTVDPDAHEAYLKGLADLEKASLGGFGQDDSIQASFDHFQRAIEIEPDWAQPYAKLAYAYHWLASNNGVALQAEFYPKSKTAALRALELDETVAQAHASLGWVLLNHEWDWAGAERAYRRSMELDPNLSSWYYARFMQAVGHHDAAIEQFKKAQERAPTSGSLQNQLSRAYLCANRFEEAEIEATTLIDGATDGFWALTTLGRILLRTSRNEEAVQVLSRARDQRVTSRDWTLSLLGYAQAEVGNLEEAHQTLLILEEMGFDWMPGLYLAMGEEDKAMAQIEAGFEARRDVLLTIRCSHAYERLIEIPRFREIVGAIGFPA